jgi:hypothetical protein
MVSESDEQMQLGPAVSVLRVTLDQILEYHDAFSLPHLIEVFLLVIILTTIKPKRRCFFLHFIELESCHQVM